jgi:hypothetical protein
MRLVYKISRWTHDKGGRLNLSEFYSFIGRHITGQGYRGRKAVLYLKKGVLWGKPDLCIVQGKVYDLQHFKGDLPEGVAHDLNFLVMFGKTLELTEGQLQAFKHPLEANGISLLEEYQLQVDLSDSLYHEVQEDWRGNKSNILKAYPFMVNNFKIITWADAEFYPLGKLISNF